MGRLFAEKTEQPTPYRRQVARRKGRNARSPEIVGLCVIGGVVVLAPMFMSAVWRACRRMLRDSLDTVGPVGDVDPFECIQSAVADIGPTMAALGAGIITCAVLANVLQRSIGWNPDRLTPDVTRLNPLGKMLGWFSPQKILLGLVSVMRFLVTVPVVLGWLWVQREPIARLSLLGPADLADQSIQLATQALLVAACSVGLWAALDYFIHWVNVERSLRMSPEEIREELRKRDGDPQLKMQRRSRHAQFSSVDPLVD